MKAAIKYAPVADNTSSGQVFAWWALAAALVAWQMFVPPIIGLADQGDFVRVLGPLGYAPQPKGPEHKYLYLTRRFDRDQTYRQPRWDQISSELIPAIIAVSLNRVLFSKDRFDLTIVGFVHFCLFLAAFYRLLQVTGSLANYRLIWAALVLILADTAYVAYWNSLYTEPSSCIWLLFLIGESIRLCVSDEVRFASVVRWVIFSVLLIGAKTQNTTLCLPLAFYGVLLARRAGSIYVRGAAVFGSVSVIAAGLTMYLSLLPAPRLTGMYNMIFMAVLPESGDPTSDLKALGLDAKYVRYSGTLAWSPNTGVADGFLVNEIQTAVTPFKLFDFYLTRPSRMWQHLRSTLSVALLLRPDFCGNFEKAAGRAPGALSYGFSLWSEFHRRALSRIACGIFAAVVISPFVFGTVLVRKRKAAPLFRHSLELAICLATACLLAFLTAAFGDAWEMVKHQYLFNLLLDTGIAWSAFAGLAGIQAALRRRRPRQGNAGPHPELP